MSEINYVQEIHTCYIPVNPRSKDGQFEPVFVRISNYGADGPASFVTDPKTDEPLDRTLYEDWVLESVERHALGSAKAIGLLIDPPEMTVITNAGTGG